MLDSLQLESFQAYMAFTGNSGPKKMAPNLVELPPEVLHGILRNTNPQDLARLCCCRTLYDFIKNDRLLYKELYLRNFDAPSGTENFSWSTELKRLVNYQKILESENASLKTAQWQIVAQCTEDLLKTAAVGSQPSLNLPFLTKMFGSQQNKDTILCGSLLFDWAKAEAWGDLTSTRMRREMHSMIANFEADPSSIDLPDISNEPFAEALEVDPMRIIRCRTDLPPENIQPLVPTRTFQERQLSAKLHCLYGVCIDTIRRERVATSRYSLRSGSAPIHPHARSRVYDLRQHTDGTMWGPFLDDGLATVDWEKMEAIMIVLDYNTKLATADHKDYQGCLEIQNKPFSGVTPNSYIPTPTAVPMQPTLPLEAQDPYNITGSWMRIVCFLDYAELYDFNFTSDDRPEEGQPRRPIDTQEAIRLITMKLQVTKIAAPGEEDGQGLPVVHFRGTSASNRPHWDPNANSKIKGTVRLTREGEVRWTSFSVYHGEERWRSEGIQIGGVRSARGVLGYWFDKDHDLHGPAGPTAFWKSHDGIEEKKPTTRDHPPLNVFNYSLY